LVAGTPTATIDPQDQIHGPYSMTTDKCGICHRTHTAKASNLLAKGSQNSGSQSTLCLACHNGTGAEPNVVAQYGLVRPINDRDQRDYYSHDAVDATPVTQHTQSQLNEFGSVDGLATPPLNRHSECSDCHNPHKATASATRDATQNTDGWGVSGRLTGVSGVEVQNSRVAGAAPISYTFLDGDTKLVTREYQVCFKCHSGFTTLKPNDDITNTPSKYALDKAVEFNPANPSFHPIEAPGKNNTAAMDASLHGASDYKLWDFNVGSTIRCLNCHASSTTPETPLPQPGSVLAPHTSSNRGILIRNYQDRVLKPMSPTDPLAAYSSGDFALCYVCHGQAPFGPPDATTAADAASQTNFKYHSKHLTGVAGKGSPGTDIDTAGDGGGNAICAECHFRLHSTTNKVGAQVLTGDQSTGSRLVNFAPNVTAFGGVISWTSTGTGSGSCTLTCHTVAHNNVSYP
jgi:predicted CXXCH cytochrome family protein